jgi:hypothetical protein
MADRVVDGLGYEPVGAIVPLPVFIAPRPHMRLRRRHDFCGLCVGEFRVIAPSLYHAAHRRSLARQRDAVEKIIDLDP